LGADEASRRTVALEQLAVLVDLYDRGMREPAPLYCKASAAYALEAVAGRDGTGSARKAWESEFRFDKEDREPEHLLVLDGQQPITALLETPARADEVGPGWDPGEPSRLGRWALRLLAPLLEREQ
jgi:exodeoxyribonuclease V gamma subunit